MTRLAIVYYSTYGTNYRMAEIAAAAARDAGAEVRLLKVAETAPEAVIATQDAWKAQIDRTAHIPVATPEDMEWANAFLFSTPTRFAGAASQIRAFIDTLGGMWAQGKLAKPASVMTSTQSPHGGQETTIMSMYTTLIHWGAILVPPGYTDASIQKTGGNPYGYSHTQGTEFTADVEAAIGHQARRLVTVAARLKG
ncbi:NAD(P)H:quinone oxidoreductase [Falsirhodobacter algicola]|uniref:NAD(P)H:quinone oxidoreductase n=1 Tax=Falsirhodobacter algicola TaxID=2692330 RepID=A0A8J8MUS8_9RHOB|nr:NAD(P)H:quinone oxidoreductase [Falsirhodobacter algicola]QUS36683.1 NAD(P)H:quinone oxidoreductase [Falsirhodobacter algicola]